MRKNILFLTDAYYYNPSPNGICVKIVADELVNRGHDVTVLTCKTKVKQKSFEVIDGANVYSRQRGIGYWLRNLADSKNGISKSVFEFISKVVSYLWVMLGAFVWPLRSPFVIFRYYRNAKKLFKRVKFNTIVGAYLGIEETLAAIMIKKKFKEVKLVIYTLDAMTGRASPVLFGSKSLARKSIERWEKYVYKKADSICVMNSHREHHKNAKYDRFRHKFKYMDIPYLKPRDTGIDYARGNGKIKIVYTGFTSKVTGDPGYFIRLLKDLPDVEFHLYGKRDEYVEELIRDSGLLNKQIFTNGRLEHKDILRIQENSDFLVSFGCMHSCMVPCKIFEYMTALKPIISFYKVKEDASYPYIERYPDSILIEEAEDKFQENLERLINFIYNTPRKQITNEYLLENYYNNTPHPMADEIIDNIKPEKVGLVTCYIDNYGACLQAFALSQSITKLGYECNIIRYTPVEYMKQKSLIKKVFYVLPKEIYRLVKYRDYRQKIARRKKFNEFRREYLVFDDKYYDSFLALSKNPPNYDSFVCGSDQLWNPVIHKNSNDKAYFLDFAPPGKKRIAYAPSIGISQAEFPDELKPEFADLINKFDYVSVRELEGKNIINSLTDKPARVVLDPTLLLNKYDWQRVFKPVDVKKPYILCYLFGGHKYIGDFVNYAAEKTGFEVVALPFKDREAKSDYRKLYNIGPAEFIWLIDNAELVITDSFHATAFAINFNTPFYSLLRSGANEKNNMNSRIFNILELTGLIDRIVTADTVLSPEFDYSMSFDEANRRLEEKRAEDIGFLQSALKGEKLNEVHMQ